jgi:hypothetical protein
LYKGIHNIADKLFFRDPVDDFLGKGDDLLEMSCNLRKKLNSRYRVQLIPPKQGPESDIRFVGGRTLPRIS